MDPLKVIHYISSRCERWEWKKAEWKPFESTSIGDIAFLLLIFFIITSSFILKQGIFFSLPSKSGSTRIDENMIVEVYPRNDGFMYNEEVINRKRFKKLLSEQRNISSEKVLVIRMAEDVKYDRLVDALSVAKETGMTKVSLKNIAGDEESEE